MLQNRLVALVYRLIVLGLTVAALVLSLGESWVSSLFYYTTQSNIFAIVVLGLLAVRTAAGLRQGVRGSAGYYPRLQAVASVVMFFTFIMYFGIIAPFAKGALEVFSFSGVVLHAVSPAALIADLILFSPCKRLKKRDILLSTIFPIVYVVQTLVLGFTKAVSYTTGEPSNFPYPFMDFGAKPLLSTVFLLCISTAFVATAVLFYQIDTRIDKPIRAQRTKGQQTNSTG